MGVLDIAVIFIFIIGIAKHEKCGGGQSFNRSTTGTLRGIAIIWILIHHVANATTVSFITRPLGYLATGMFFFIAGFGNEYSLEKTLSTSWKWIVNKLKKLYTPYIVGYIALVIADNLYDKLTIKEICVDLITFSLPNMETWFPKIIMMCFVMHWTINKMWHPYKNKLLFCVVGCCVCVMYGAKLSPYWYNSVMLYPIGTLFARSNYLETLPQKRKLCYGLAILFLTLLGASQIKNNITIQIVMCIVFALMIYCFLYGYKLHSIILEWVGERSFEYYIYHYSMLLLFENLKNISVLGYLMIVFVSTSIIIVCYSGIANFIRKVWSENIQYRS